MTRFQVRKKLLKASTGKTLTGFSLRKKLLKAGSVKYYSCDYFASLRYARNDILCLICFSYLIANS
jgi:hypothetical protein